MKLRLMALTIACAGMIIALPTGASANWRQNNNNYLNYRSDNGDADYWKQIGQGWHNFDSNKNIMNDTFFKSYRFNSNDGKINGNLIILNMNNTTGSAVTISFSNNTTTSSAVNVSFDTTTTTAPAVNVSFDKLTNFDDVMNEYNTEEEKINAWMKDFQNQMDRDFDRTEKQEERFWRYFNK